MSETKRYVVEDYPLDRLPADVRSRFEDVERVRLTVEAVDARPSRRTIAEILKNAPRERALRDDPVERVRALRDEWGHREDLHAGIRRGETS